MSSSAFQVLAIVAIERDNLRPVIGGQRDIIVQLFGSVAPFLYTFYRHDDS